MYLSGDKNSYFLPAQKFENSNTSLYVHLRYVLHNHELFLRYFIQDKIISFSFLEILFLFNSSTCITKLIVLFFQSDRKSDKPLSVRGWLYIDFKNFGGTVATSAPNFAESTMS